VPTAYVVGAGRLASALVPGLRAARWRVAGLARSPKGRSRLERLGAAPMPREEAREFDLVFLAVPDSVVPDALRGIEPYLRRGQVVAHGAGALGLDVLAPAGRRGAHAGSLHPVQALVGGTFLPGVVAAVDGDAVALRLLSRAARDLRLRPIRVPAEGRVLYHAAAVIASNLTLALADVASETWIRSGAPRSLALEALVPLLRASVDNLALRGLPGALTGPVARGDADVVARQLRALRGEAAASYRLLSRRLVDIALRGGLDRARARAVLAAIDPAPPRRRKPRPP